MPHKLFKLSVIIVFLIMVLGFVTIPTTTKYKPHEVRILLHQKKSKPIFRFTSPIETYDTSWYQAERFAVYNEIYSFFERNPKNYKSLSKGNIVLCFSKNSQSRFQFDSILNSKSKQNTKVMNLFAKSFASPAFTDSNKIVISIFIRRSNAFSLSVDTLDIMNPKNKFTAKTIKLFVENSIVISETLELNSIIEPFKIKKTPNVERELYVYTHVEQKAIMKGGEQTWYDFIDDNIYIPGIVKEEEFECKIKVFFEVDKSGKINNITFSRIYPNTSNYFESSYSEMEKELTRVLKKQSNLWIPKKVNGVVIKSKLSTIFTLKFEK